MGRNFNLLWAMQQVFHPIRKKKIYLISIKIMGEKRKKRKEGKRAHLCFSPAVQTEFDPLRVCVCMVWTHTEDGVRTSCVGCFHPHEFVLSQLHWCRGLCWDLFRLPLSAQDPGPPSPAHGHRGHRCSAEGWAVGSSFKLLQKEWAGVSMRGSALAAAGGCVEKQHMSSHPLRQ